MAQRVRWMLLATVVPSVVVGGSAAHAEFLAYTFTRIADTSVDLARFGAFVAINNSGTVAFLAEQKQGGYELYTSNGVSTTIIASRSEFGGLGHPLGINDTGAVAFTGQRIGSSAGDGIYVGNGGTPTEMANNGPGSSFGGFRDPAISNTGELAFIAQQKSGPLQVLAGAIAPFDVIAQSGGSIADFRSGPDMNALGDVAFSVLRSNGAMAVLATNGGVLTTIAETDFMFESFGGRVAINDVGQVAFHGNLVGGGEGLLLSSGTGPRLIADTTSQFGMFNDWALNNHGSIAFFANVRDVGDAIFIENGFGLQRVVGGQDDLGFGIVSGLDSGSGSPRISINDAGQIAFMVRMTNGTFAVVRADPHVVPLPSTLMMCGTVLALLPLMRRRISGASLRLPSG